MAAVCSQYTDLHAPGQLDEGSREVSSISRGTHSVLQQFAAGSSQPPLLYELRDLCYALGLSEQDPVQVCVRLLAGNNCHDCWLRLDCSLRESLSCALRAAGVRGTPVAAAVGRSADGAGLDLAGRTRQLLTTQTYRYSKHVHVQL